MTQSKPHRHAEYRFAEPKIVSSLTDREIDEIFWAEEAPPSRDGSRGIANAAAQRAIEDLEVPSFNWFQLNKGIDQSSELFISIVSRYLKELKEGKL